MPTDKQIAAILRKMAANATSLSEDYTTRGIPDTAAEFRARSGAYEAAAERFSDGRWKQWVPVRASHRARAHTRGRPLPRARGA